MQLFVGLLFGMSGFLIFLYLGNSFTEKRMIARRIEMLQGSEAPTIVTKENLVDMNFSTKGKPIYT